ncbi:adenylate kinase 5, chloroplastic-like isoform X2 [Carica papaya]|uniref:adenylate kinase 5, chloroplastic-like isoform X2 n=1 Tax=Carica papaya TaxID=3649 RepID=UPI000B8CCBC0|nr:adenylate kinase 5, chloroplastic-like isoform X2 [Carica papaya]
MSVASLSSLPSADACSSRSLSPLKPFLSPSSSLFLTASPLGNHRLLSSGLVCNTSLGIRPKSKEILKVCCSTNEPLKVMISGAPASGKGTQCELIVQKFGLVHISTGDLLRAEVSSGTDIGKKAKEFMNAGQLVPDEIVTAMVTARLSREDAKERGWLLDGYPRSSAQAQSLEKLKIIPDIYVVLDMCWKKVRPSNREDLSSKKFPSRD